MASIKTATALGVRPMALPESAALALVAIDLNWSDFGTINVGDVAHMADIPPGFDVMDWRFITDDIDSNGAPTAAFSLGFLNAGKTALNGGTDTWTAAGGVTSPQTGGHTVPTGATAANAFLTGKTSAVRSVGLVCTAAPATAALAGKRATLVLTLRG